eukprot:scaffold90863_cov58-Phaeocystis_antarctica.AAC.1
MDVNAIRHQPQVPGRARATLERIEPAHRTVHAVRAARRVVAAEGHVDIAVAVGEAVPRRGACRARDLEQKVAVHREPQVESRNVGRPQHRGPCRVLHAS